MITTPLQQLSRAAGSFAGGEKGYTKDSVISLNIRSKDEIGDLYRDIRSMEERIVDYTDHLTRITAEREHTETELHTAYGIQMSMLPSVFPDRREYDLCASMAPAKEVGGDFYDFFLIDDTHLALVIADVSDKGVPAALFMMYAKILLSYRARLGGSPSEIIRDINEEIGRDNPSEMFVTVWLGILEIPTGRLCCCNAGHEYPFLRQGGSFSLLKDKHGLAIGMRSNIRYSEYEIQLQPGDAVFVYTDGVPEARNAREEFYGLKRTEETLNRCPSDTAEAVLQAIRDDNARFVGDATQFDDLTVLCLIYRGTEKA